MWHHRMTEFSAVIDEFRTVVIKSHFNLLPPIYIFIFQVVSFFQVSPPESCVHSLVPTTCHMPSPPHLYSVGHRNIIWHGVQVMNLLVIQFSPVFCHFLSLSPRYFPQHPILTQPQYDQPCLTPTHNWQNYICVYFNLHVFRYQTERQKILDQMAAEIPSV
jgi:hypothetical protein